MREDVAKLIRKIFESDDYGELVETKSMEREVFVTIRSVGMKETHQAQAFGLKPEIVFVLANAFDYEDEEFVEYNGKTYTVIRTFQKRSGEKLEIVCGHRLNGGAIYGNA